MRSVSKWETDTETNALTISKSILIKRLSRAHSRDVDEGEGDHRVGRERRRRRDNRAASVKMRALPISGEGEISTFTAFPAFGLRRRSLNFMDRWRDKGGSERPEGENETKEGVGEERSSKTKRGLSGAALSVSIFWRRKKKKRIGENAPFIFPPQMWLD